MATYTGITLPVPHSPETPIHTVDSLKEHLQAAMQVEFYTIPLYLFGMFSIKTQQTVSGSTYSPTSIVSSVVVEEMLHLTLAGNILRAIGGTPKIYDQNVIPKYPSTMPGRIPALDLNLRVMTPENVQTFIDFETPEAKNAQPEPGKYHTLGQFYDAIKQGLIYLNGTTKDLFHLEFAPYQFAPGVGYTPAVADAGGSVVVKDLTTALLAITTIVDQGEGNPRPFDDPGKLEEDHYDKFLDLKNLKFGTWECYPVRSNPVTIDYRDKDKDLKIYHVSLTFDAAYCFLLLTIEKLWNTSATAERQTLVSQNLDGIMFNILSPLAKFLVQQPIGNTRMNAAPAFNWYKYEPGSTLQQLEKEVQAAIDAYAGSPDALKVLQPIQVFIKKLQDITIWLV